MLALETKSNRHLDQNESQKQRNITHTLAAAAVLRCGAFLRLLLQLFIVLFLLCLHEKVLKEECVLYEYLVGD